MKVLTHDGIFHADEIMSCAVLQLLYDGELEITRSRKFADDPEKAKEFDLILDIGGRYDANKYFDHHQTGGAGVREENGIQYATFGLIWKEYGIRFIERALMAMDTRMYGLTSEEIAAIHKEMDLLLISFFDAHDNGELIHGVSRTNSNKGIVLEDYNIPQFMALFNPIAMVEDFNSLSQHNEFRALVEILGVTFLRRVVLKKVSRILGVKMIQELDKGEPILILDRFCEWNTPVLSRPHIKFVVYPRIEGDGFTVQVGKNTLGFGTLETLRCPFPEEWAGKRGKEFADLTGIEDAFFCHRNRYLASAGSKGGAIKLAQQALKQNE